MIENINSTGEGPHDSYHKLNPCCAKKERESRATAPGIGAGELCVLGLRFSCRFDVGRGHLARWKGGYLGGVDGLSWERGGNHCGSMTRFLIRRCIQLINAT